MWEAALWGLLGGSTLVIGAALGLRFTWSTYVVGLIMAFGAGVLIASVAYELVDDAARVGTFAATAGGLAAGSATFFVGDLLVTRAGAGDRKRSAPVEVGTKSVAPAAGASGAALALGALLDGIPESAAIGITILDEGAPSIAFIAAVALSNLPEGLSSATGMRAAGRSKRHIMGLWVGIALLSSIAAGLGYVLLDGASADAIAFVMTFAAGAILCMLASTMLPEAAADGGPVVGLVTAAGFLASVLLDRL
jgi:ZIP family zinc transporter